MAKEKSIEVDGVVYTESGIRNAVAKSAAIAKAAQDYLTYSTNVNGIPPRMGSFDVRQCSDGGRMIESYWALFNALHPDEA